MKKKHEQTTNKKKELYSSGLTVKSPMYSLLEDQSSNFSASKRLIIEKTISMIELNR